ncbi:MAG: nucleotidyltransferase domain-containing protein [Flavisolibacter sp.]|nr:nucleotidyltransferase domain-containing protein [Flavisolibacter sp.]
MSNQKQAILLQIKQAVLETDPGAEVILFGSQARGDSRPESDWDILIVTENEINKDYEEKVLQILLNLQLELEIDINYVMQTRGDWEQPTAIPLYNEIKKEGVRL